MDLRNQARVKESAEKYGNRDLIVILGGAEADVCGIAVETVSTGDPSYAGPLSEIPLGLKAYHIFELKDEIPPEVYEEHIGFMETVFPVEDIIKECRAYRSP
ncbi:glycine/sarcosine/betaine reductase complex protein A [Candidatus Formimonas warabiya]|uniref:Glycine/sarcosine/betaine reductase complex protein A n=3 Tax=Formimonas warabiya TaxID=1761012 RepID=A0A3G1KXJ6_FORW1|nr:glycine/sarcosine/betaine reductase complex protein A [Candidatus Formimonas warabiya]